MEIPSPTSAKVVFRSFGLFPLTWKSRRFLLFLVRNPYFQFSILFLIFVNGVLLSLHDPINVDANSLLLLQQSEYFFLSVFSLEALCKLFAFGIYFEEHGRMQTLYFKSNWNRIDFFLVILGWIQLGTSNFFQLTPITSPLRLIRLLPPLQHITSIPAFHWVTHGLFHAAPQLFSALLLFLVVQSIFAVSGLIYFQGALRQRCFGEELSLDSFCALDSLGRQCNSSTSCYISEFNPNYNLTSFDNLLGVFVILFEIVTMEGWAEVMNWMSDTRGEFSQVYFLLLSIMGAWLLVNLLLAMIAVHISVQRKIDEETKQVQQELTTATAAQFPTSTSLHDFQHYKKFLKRHKISLVQSLQMRLMLSYERMHLVEGYSLVSLETFEKLQQDNPHYLRWKEYVEPVLNPIERIAFLKRRQEQRGEDLPITPPFVKEEICILENEQEALVEKKKKSYFSRLDAWVTKTLRRFQNWRNAVQVREVAGEVCFISPFFLDTDTFKTQRLDAFLIRKWAFHLVTSPAFDRYFMSVVILFNLAVLSSVHYNQPMWLFDVQSGVEVSMFAIYLLEMILKIVGFGLAYYVTNVWCVFEGFLTVLGIFQFFTSTNYLASALRALRLFRLFKFLSFHKDLKRVFQALVSTVKVVIPLISLIVLFLWIFSLVGLHAFGDKMVNSPENCSEEYLLSHAGRCPPRANFDNLSNAMLTSFQLLMSDNWNKIYFDTARGTLSMWSFFYFFASVSLGSFILLNIFLGVLIDAFLVLRALEEEEDVRDSKRWTIGMLTQPRASVDDVETVFPEGNNEHVPIKSRRSSRKSFTSKRNSAVNQPDEALEALKEFLLEKVAIKAKSALSSNFSLHPSSSHLSLRCLHANRFPRKQIGKVVLSKAFTYFMLSVVLASMLSLCFSQAPHWELSLGFSFVFFLEFVCKVVAFGFMGHEGAYLKDKFNALDFVLLLLQLASDFLLIFLGYNSLASRLCQATRALYAFRLVRYSERMRVALFSLKRALRAVIQLFVVMLCFYVIFAVLSTLLFRGRFYGCFDDGGGGGLMTPQEDLNITSCSATWRNPSYGGIYAQYSFDNTLDSLLMLLELSTLENWMFPMYNAMDVTQVGQNPSRETFASFASTYFCLLVLLFNTLLMQLFVAVVVDSFWQSQREEEGRAFLTPRQAEWIKMKKSTLTRLPLPMGKQQAFHTWWRKKTHVVITSRTYKRFRMLMIMSNTVVLLSLHYNYSLLYFQFFQAWDYVVGAFYATDFLLRLGAFGPRQVYARALNWLWLLVCLMTFCGWAVDALFWPSQVVDSLQILQVLFYFPTTSDLLFTLSLSMPALVNVFAIMMLIFYVYAIVGVSVFAHTLSMENSVANAHFNFDSFDTALVSLLQMSTGEGWNGLMRDMAAQSSAFAIVFCLSFVVLLQFLFMNLLVAVLMVDLEEETESLALNLSSRVSRRNCAEFAKTWARCRFEFESQRGPQVSHSSKEEQLRLPFSMLPQLLSQLSPPLGLRGVRFITRSDVLKVIRSLQIPVSPMGEIQYHTTLHRLLDQVILQDAINRALTYVTPLSTPPPVPILTGVLEELEKMLHLTLPKHTVEFEKQWLEDMPQRGDGYDCSHLLATRLLHKAVLRWLKKRYGASRRNSQQVSVVVGAAAVEDDS